MGPGVGRRDAAHEKESRADKQETRRDQPLDRHGVGEPAGEAGGEEQRAAQDEEAHTCRDGGQQEHVLQVEDDVGEEREERGAQSEGGEQTAGERRLPEEAEVQHRRLLAQLGPDEGHEEDGRCDEGAHDECDVQPSAVERIMANTSAARPPENVTKPSQSGLVAAGFRDSSTMRSVTTRASTPIGTLTKKIQRHPMPLVMRPPRTGPIGDGDTAHRPEDAEGDPSVPAAEGVREESERCREHDRPADALEAAGEDEEERTGGDAAQERADGERDDADGEHEPPPEQVGEGSRREEEGGERQGVGVEDPLKVRQRGMEGVLDRREGDVHDREVEEQHEDPDADGAEGPPLTIHLVVLLETGARRRQPGRTSDSVPAGSNRQPAE